MTVQTQICGDRLFLSSATSQAACSCYDHTPHAAPAVRLVGSTSRSRRHSESGDRSCRNEQLPAYTALLVLVVQAVMLRAGTKLPLGVETKRVCSDGVSTASKSAYAATNRRHHRHYLAQHGDRNMCVPSPGRRGELHPCESGRGMSAELGVPLETGSWVQLQSFMHCSSTLLYDPTNIVSIFNVEFRPAHDASQPIRGGQELDGPCMPC